MATRTAAVAGALMLIVTTGVGSVHAAEDERQPVPLAPNAIEEPEGDAADEDADLEAPYGTLVATDPSGDTRTGHTPWLDVRELWLDSDGVELTVTLVLDDLRERQPLDTYEVEFLNDRDDDGLFDTSHDSLRCDPGSMEAEDGECRYTYMEPEGGNDVKPVRYTLDPDADAIQASIAYADLHATGGDALTGIQAFSQIDAEHQGGARITDDSAHAPDPYVLADGPGEPDPTHLDVWDPEGDASAPFPWLDLTGLTLTSDGAAVTATLEIADLTENQQADLYDIEFSEGSEPDASTTPGTDPVRHDELSCQVAPGPQGEHGCEYIHRDEGGERTSQEVATSIDRDANTITATIPYQVIGLDAGGELEVFDAQAWIDAAGAALGTDTLHVDRVYVLDGETPDPDPGPDLGTPLATDPAGDTRSGKNWLDLRALWTISDGEHLTVILQAEGLHEGQYADQYEVNLTDGAEPTDDALVGSRSTDDALECEVGTDVTSERGCTFTRRDADGTTTQTQVPMSVDLGQDTITARIPYDALASAPGDTLHVLEATSWEETAYTAVGDDEILVDAQITLT